MQTHKNLESIIEGPKEADLKNMIFIEGEDDEVRSAFIHLLFWRHFRVYSRGKLK